MFKKKKTSVRQISDGNYFLGQERSDDDGIHATRGHKNVRVYCKTLKNCIGSFRTKGVEC
jgi:hypothetical protein